MLAALLALTYAAAPPLSISATAPSAAEVWTHEATFSNEAEPLDFTYGYHVALADATIAVGASVGEASGVFVYDLVGGAWSEPTWIELPGTEYIDDVGLSGDDLLTIVADNGIFSLNRSGDGWSAPSTVLALDPFLSWETVPAIGDQLMAMRDSGYSESCGHDVDRVLIFRRSGQTWTADGELMDEGCPLPVRRTRALAVDGERLVRVRSLDTPEPGVPNGAAEIYERTGDATWTRTALIESTGDDPNDGFATAAISGPKLALGSPAAQMFEGRVELFAEVGDAWVSTATILRPPDDSLMPSFGGPLALDGGTLAVGCPYDGFTGEYRSGAVYLYDVVDAPVDEGVLRMIETNTLFGAKLALRGARLVVGTGYFDEPDPHNVHVYTRSGGPVAPCAADSDCGEAGVCVQGVCVPEDTSDSATGGADTDKEGCGCKGGGSTPAGALGLVVLVGLARRRRASGCW
ncbi:MAG: hypothetical protein H6711_04780 [Myxococcales bacterium]|nr:hypothetical protein [Myxococcales bacterium]